MGYADLHMHTTASDGKASVIELLNFVNNQRPHLDVVAITDHDTMNASLWAYEQQYRYNFDIVPGVEVSSRDGHILALWVKQTVPRNLSLADTVQAIHEIGGLAIVAHPIHPYIPTHFLQALRYIINPTVLQQANVDAIEVHNAGIAGTGFNWLARWVAKRVNLAVTSGSDAHTLGAIGTGETCFDGRTAADLRYALEASGDNC